MNPEEKRRSKWKKYKDALTERHLFLYAEESRLEKLWSQMVGSNPEEAKKIKQQYKEVVEELTEIMPEGFIGV